MWQTAECNGAQAGVDARSQAESGAERKQRIDIVDLFEELLSKRAELGFRPMIYVSSERDLECSLIGMFELAATSESEGEAVPALQSVDELRRRLT